MAGVDASEIIERLARPLGSRTEADIQSDVRALLLWGGLDLEDNDVNLESPVNGGRIDIEAGSAVIEIKRTLRQGQSIGDAETQLAGYLRTRQREHGSRYVGILTDGRDWLNYHLDPDGVLVRVSEFRAVGSESTDELVVWLEGILATRASVSPTPLEIERRLGAGSSASQLDLSELLKIYQKYAELPTVQVKNELWARLLTVAFGTKFTASAELFVRHTYLTVVAELIAHAVLGYDLRREAEDAEGLLQGTRFSAARIVGVVEADFFDWVLELPEGRSWASQLAKRLARFDWSGVHHDVLKLLYESVIDVQTRHGLGEYYTPDWLAQSILDESFVDPLEQRLADVACGSGTFLFHAVRKAVAACQESGLTGSATLESVTSRIFGLDVHPVAVTLARVTYLLALGPDLLLGDRNELAVPVYLGDAVQYRNQHNVMSDDGLSIYTSDGAQLIDSELRFPASTVRDPTRFDYLVSEMADEASSREPGSPRPSIRETYNRLGIAPEDRSELDATFAVLCRLHDEGRNHIWGYYVRNASRPQWLSRVENRVDVLVGNPPWLAYNFMPTELQENFRRLATARGLWPGARFVTKQDLSSLFVARAIEQYLKIGGSFAFVMPHSALDRPAYAGFRSGSWQSDTAAALADFGTPWDLAAVRPQPFPVTSCVVFGTREKLNVPMGSHVVAWSGNPDSNLVRSESDGNNAEVGESVRSPYAEIFAQGATIAPRLLFRVDEASADQLGLPAGLVRVQSSRGSREKRPWRDLPGLTGQIEKPFVFPVLSGDDLVPFRIVASGLGVFPWDGEQLLSPTSETLSRWPGLAAWWRNACEVWEANKSGSANLTLAERLDYQRGFSSQMGKLAPVVYYTASGSNLTAAWTADASAVTTNALYWSAVGSVDEARYLSAVLNAPTTTIRLERLRGPRHIHLYVWNLPIPAFDKTKALHEELAELAQVAESLVAQLDTSGLGMIAARRKAGDLLAEAGVLQRLDEAVNQLLDGPRSS